MIAVGLDLSSNTGYAVLEVNGTESTLKACELIDVDTARHKHAAMAAGLPPEFAYISQGEEVADRVYDRLSRLPLAEISSITIEQTNLGRDRNVQKELEFIHYAVLKRLQGTDLIGKVEYVDSSKWRSLCEVKLSKEQRAHNKAVKAKTARGKVTWKHLSVQWVNARFGLNFLVKDNDRADAICLAYSGIELKKLKTTKKIDIDSLFSS